MCIFYQNTHPDCLQNYQDYQSHKAVFYVSYNVHILPKHPDCLQNYQDYHKQQYYTCIVSSKQNRSHTLPLTQVVHDEVKLTTVHHHFQWRFQDHIVHWNRPGRTVSSWFLAALLSQVLRERVCETEWRRIPSLSCIKKKKKCFYSFGSSAWTRRCI